MYFTKEDKPFAMQTLTDLLRKITPYSFPLAILLGLALPAAPLSAQLDPSDFPRATLDNGVVKMSLYLPDPDRGSYRATRFDWSGIIYSTQYQGHEYFGYWKNQHDPTFHEDLSGPAESYKKPGLGYEEAKPGEGFIRIGVGVVEKADEKEYDQFKTYPILDHGEWKVKHNKKRIRFIHRLSSPSGYGYVYTKTIRLSRKEPGFIIDHQLKNTGRKKIQTDQFNHNFFIIDGEETGPNLEVTFPFPLQTENDLKGLARLDGNKLRFLRHFENTSVWMQLTGYNDSPEQHTFTVHNQRTGAGATVTVDKPLYRMDFWACQTTFSPENYVFIDVDPGKKFRWRATYKLFVWE